MQGKWSFVIHTTNHPREGAAYPGFQASGVLIGLLPTGGRINSARLKIFVVVDFPRYSKCESTKI